MVPFFQKFLTVFLFVFLLPSKESSAFPLKNAEELMQQFENTLAPEWEESSRGTYLGYCFSSYPVEKKDHIHGENGEIIPVDPNSLPDEKIVRESSMIWIDDLSSEETQAKANFGNLEIYKLQEHEKYLEEIELHSDLLSFDTALMKQNQNDSAWHFLNDRSQIIEIDETFFLIFEYMILEQSTEGQMIAERFQVMKALDGGKDKMKTRSLCIYPLKIPLKENTSP